MNSRHLVLMTFYTKSGKLLLQDRKSISKWGERWGIWGGKVEEGETVMQALKREMKEEVDIEIHDPEYVGKFMVTRKDLQGIEWEVSMDIFIQESEEDLARFKVLEGDGARFATIDEAKELTKYPFGYDNVIVWIENYLNKKSKD